MLFAIATMKPEDIEGVIVSTKALKEAQLKLQLRETSREAGNTNFFSMQVCRSCA